FASGGSGGDPVINKPEALQTLPGSGNEPIPTSGPETVNSDTPIDLPAATGVRLSGKLTFDSVPFYQTTRAGLDYSATETRPARGVTVQLLNDRSQVIATGQTDHAGHYQFDVEPDSNVQVRVFAQLLGQLPASWNIQVADNTRSDAHYMVQGALAPIGRTDQVRNLHAPSGWTGTGYDGSRSAGPFAILDAVYSALDVVVSVNPNLT